MKNSNNESGIYFILSAVIVTALVGIIALAVDMGALYGSRLQLQKVADSAVAVGLAWDASHRDIVDTEPAAGNRNKVIDAVIALNRQNIDIKSITKTGSDANTRLVRNVMTSHHASANSVTNRDFTMAYPNGDDVRDDNGSIVVVPPQGIGISISITPKLHFSVLKNIPGIQNRVSSIGQLKPANIALLLDFSGSMCCDLIPDDPNPNCNIAACSPIRDAFVDDIAIPTIGQNSKAAHLIVAVEKFLKNFKNQHDNISFTLFNSVAENRFPMNSFTEGRGAPAGINYQTENRVITWYPDPIETVQESDNMKVVTSLPKFFNNNPLNTWGRIVFGTGSQNLSGAVTGNTIFSGNTNPSDALIRAFLDTQETYRRNGTNPTDSGPIHYVFFTDGAPTAGRFFIPSNNNGTKRTTPNSMDSNPNIYNPFELPVNGVTCNGTTNCKNVGDYYNFKNMYVWETDVDGKPIKFQYAPSPLIYTALYEGSGDNDDGNIVGRLSSNTISSSVNFTNLDMAQFGSKWEGIEIDGIEIESDDGSGQKKYEYKNGTATNYAWDDDFFRFIPPCTYGGTDRETVYRDEYPSPTVSPGINPAPSPTIDPDSHTGQHTHQQSNYRLWFETANLGLCCDRSGIRMENKGDDLFKIGADVRDLPVDLCDYTVPDDRLCPEATNYTIPPLSAYPNDKVWEKQNRCLAPRDGGNLTRFLVPFNSRHYDRNLSDPFSDNWAKLYYDAAIEYADMIRDNNGVIYAIGLGADPIITNDFYQGVHDDYRRHDFFLTRLALDPYLFEVDRKSITADQNSDLGCALKDSSCSITSRAGAYNTKRIKYQQQNDSKMWDDDWGVASDDTSVIFKYGKDYNHRHQYGLYLPTNDPEKLSDLFQQVAKKILLSLAQ